MSNNKRRLLSLLSILKEESDKEHTLKEQKIKDLLSKNGISIQNRKTIYEDIESLIDFDYEVYYDTYSKGYYLDESPFSLAETKILLDSINSIGLDDKSKNQLVKKILSFVSKYQAHFLINNQFSINNNKSHNKSYIQNLETILDAINNRKVLIIEYNKKESLVMPYFIYYSNSKYYLFVKYKDNNNIYSYRLDRLSNIHDTNETFEYSSDIIETIKKRIKTSYGNLDKSAPEIIQLECSNYNSLINRLEDDFPNHYLDNKGNIVLEYRPNELFFSKLANYGDQVKIIAPASVRKNYIKYLENIISCYSPKNTSPSKSK